MHTGVSFHVRDEIKYLGAGHRRETHYIEVSVSNVVQNSTLEGYVAPSAPSHPSVATEPVVAVAAAIVGAHKTPGERMRELDQMKGLLTDDEYQQKRAEILSDV